MAERRMFAKSIIDSDAFLDLPISAQALYFHLAMRADDDGFINKPRAIMNMIGARNEDAKVLCDRKFLIPFDSGVVVIKHWRIHNFIRRDTYHETKYKFEKASLYLDENGSYSQNEQNNDLVTGTLRERNETDTEVRLGKDRLGKDRLGKVSIGQSSIGKEKGVGETPTTPEPTSDDLKNVFSEIDKRREKWKTLTDNLQSDDPDVQASYDRILKDCMG